MTDRRLKRIGSVINLLARLSRRAAGAIAVRLFISPKRSPYSAEMTAWLDAAEPLALPFDVPLAAYRWGESGAGRRVLLVHGWESHAARWLPLAQRLLARGAEVFAFDAPASGRSGGKVIPFNLYIDAAAAFEALHGPFDVFVGHSLGGGVVAQLASRLPIERRPQRVVVMASFDESEHVFDRYHSMLGLSARVRAAFDRLIVGQLAGDLVVRDYSNTAAVAMLGDVEGLVIHSQDDEVSPYEEGLALHRAWPNSQMLTYTDEQHKLTGERVLEAIINFVFGADD